MALQCDLAFLDYFFRFVLLLPLPFGNFFRLTPCSNGASALLSLLYGSTFSYLKEHPQPSKDIQFLFNLNEIYLLLAFVAFLRQKKGDSRKPRASFLYF